MSAAFTHGGLDRTSPAWAVVDIDERDNSDSQGRSGRDSGFGRGSHPAFVYGGIDRDPILWHNESAAPDLAIE
jgi:hypothetical protein